MTNFIIFMGPPGCGKGTQSALLVERGGYHHISTGALLRREIESHSKIGQEIESLINAGHFISDEMIQDLLVDYLKKSSTQKSYILDGFPRTLHQAEWFMHYLQKTGGHLLKVFYFHVNQEILIKRLTGRFTCARCGATYNDYFKAPRVSGVCDRCEGGQFSRRKDDDPDHVRTRLKTYAEKTEPLIHYYESSGHMLKVDADRGAANVSENVLKALI